MKSRFFCTNGSCPVKMDCVKHTQVFTTDKVIIQGQGQGKRAADCPDFEPIAVNNDTNTIER